MSITMKRIYCCLLSILFVLALGACSAANYAPKTEQFTPGTYETTGKGHNGEIVVVTTFDKNRVTKIEVVSHEESLSVGDTAMQTTAEAVIDKQGFDVDVVSGATYSSVALLEAVSKAAIEAGGTGAVITMDTLPKAELVVPEPPYAPGTYVASAEGFHGDITVTIEVDENSILSLVALGPEETEGIGVPVLKQLPDTILAAGTPDVDVVSGATWTSNGIINATVAALEQAK